jgi:hypothetical protein
LVLKEEKGPIEILCKEIGFVFHKKMESPEMLAAFVSVLVERISSIRATQVQIARMGGEPPSAGSEEVLRLVTEMLASNDVDGLARKAAETHDVIHRIVPDDAYPCDHLIDMLSSCVSAIRFGLEKPCRSRHAAEAASHVWRHVYGVRLFDSFTSSWGKEWARAQFQAAMAMRLP